VETTGSGAGAGPHGTTGSGTGGDPGAKLGVRSVKIAACGCDLSGAPGFEGLWAGLGALVTAGLRARGRRRRL
jgi:hypothetical protein